MTAKHCNRWFLRDATAALHAELDIGMNRFTMTDPGDYENFLSVLQSGIGAVELGLEAGGVSSVLPDWHLRTRRAALAADLGGLCSRRKVEPIPPANFDGIPQMMGAAYVLEGSRLGSQVILRRTSVSPAATVRENMRFLAHGDVATMWPSFLAALDLAVTDDDGLEAAVEGAKKAFRVCQAALDEALPDRLNMTGHGS